MESGPQTRAPDGGTPIFFWRGARLFSQSAVSVTSFSLCEFLTIFCFDLGSARVVLCTTTTSCWPRRRPPRTPGGPRMRHAARLAVAGILDVAVRRSRTRGGPAARTSAGWQGTAAELGGALPRLDSTSAPAAFFMRLRGRVDLPRRGGAWRGSGAAARRGSRAGGQATPREAHGGPAATPCTPWPCLRVGPYTEFSPSQAFHPFQIGL